MELSYQNLFCKNYAYNREQSASRFIKFDKFRSDWEFANRNPVGKQKDQNKSLNLTICPKCDKPEVYKNRLFWQLVGELPIY